MARSIVPLLLSGFLALSLAVGARADAPLAVLAAAGDGVLVGDGKSGLLELRYSGDTVGLDDTVIAGPDQALQLLFPDRSAITLMKGTILRFVDVRPGVDVPGEQIAMELVSGRIDLRASPDNTYVVLSGGNLVYASNAIATILASRAQAAPRAEAAAVSQDDAPATFAALGSRKTNARSLWGLARAQVPDHQSDVNPSDDLAVMLVAAFGLFDNSDIKPGETIEVIANDRDSAVGFGLLAGRFIDSELGLTEEDSDVGSDTGDSLAPGEVLDRFENSGQGGDEGAFQTHTFATNGVVVFQQGEMTTFGDHASFFDGSDCCTHEAGDAFADASQYDGQVGDTYYGWLLSNHGDDAGGTQPETDTGDTQPEDLPGIPAAGQMPDGAIVVGGLVIINGIVVGVAGSDTDTDIGTDFPDDAEPLPGETAEDEADHPFTTGPADSAFKNTELAGHGGSAYYPTTNTPAAGSSYITGLLGSDPATDAEQQAADESAAQEAMDMTNMTGGGGGGGAATMGDLQAVNVGSISASAAGVSSGGLIFNWSLNLNYAARTVSGSITGIETVGEVGAPFRRIDGSENYAGANAGDPANFQFNSVLNCAGCTADVSFIDADSAVVDVNALGNTGTFNADLN